MRTKEMILKMTDGLVGSAVNAVLWWFYLYGASFGKSRTSYGAHQMFREADEAIRDFNYDSFKQILAKLQRQKLIKRRKKYSQLEIEITEMGKARIASLFPVYRTKRPWDGYVYLISYDVPEQKRGSRDLLRRYLKDVGCAYLQKSLWIAPYSPRKLLDEFMSSHAIEGTVLVSRLSKDGAIGDEGIGELLERVYGLKKIDERYREFIYHVREGRKTKFRLAMEFQAIVANDPQLPFQLLPQDWQGNAALAAYQKLCTI